MERADPRQWSSASLLGSAVLTAIVFALDLAVPLGVANGVLYLVPVLLALSSSWPQSPIVIAAVCSGLTIAGTFLSPSLAEVPRWIAGINRALSLVIIWVPVLYFLERRRAQAALEKAYQGLELQVQERTQSLTSANKELEAQILERHKAEEAVRSLAAQLLTAQDAERRRISRDLHDDINQRLAILAVEVATLDQHLGKSPNRVREGLKHIQQRVGELSDDVRRLAYQFHPSILDDLGLATALQRYVEDFTARTGIRVRLECRSTPESLPRDITSCLYRVAQESLGNVAKHAGVSEAAVEVEGAEDHVSLTVSDAGVGMARDAAGHQGDGLGLVSMKERVRLVGGDIAIESGPGDGTRIRVRVPRSGGEP